jgi:hypothetical protein
MVNFRKKSEQVYAQGALERGEFQPTGAPLKVYMYWHSRAKNPPANENFCHFWRVVAIWAPLTAVRSVLARMAEKPLTWLFVFALYAIGMLVLGATVSWAFPAAFLAVPYLTIGAAIGGEAGKRNKRLGDIGGGMKLPFWVTSPISVPAFYVSRYANSLTPAQSDAWTMVFGIGAALILVGVIALAIIAGAMDIGWAVLFYVFGIPLGIAALALGLMALGAGIEWLVQKHRVRSKARRQARLDKIRAQREAFLTGKSDYDPYAVKQYVPSAFEQKIANFFKGVGDFLSLAWNVVRVNKWKICPMVKIDSGVITK